jgi:hypothetical protein
MQKQNCKFQTEMFEKIATAFIENLLKNKKSGEGFNYKNL